MYQDEAVGTLVVATRRGDHLSARDRRLLETLLPQLAVNLHAIRLRRDLQRSRERPDVVVMDLKMPEVDGIEATRRLTEAIPGVAVLVLTMYEDDDSVFAAMRAGARGYLLRGRSRTRSSVPSRR